MPLAAEYMKKAGYPSGKYTGGQTFLMVSDNADAALNVGEVAPAAVREAGLQGQAQA